MTSDTRIYDTPAGINLGPLDLIAPNGARGFVVQFRAGRFHGFVVRRSDDVYGYVDRCPHMGLPLARTLDGKFAVSALDAFGARRAPYPGNAVREQFDAQRLGRIVGDGQKVAHPIDKAFEPDTEEIGLPLPVGKCQGERC